MKKLELENENSIFERKPFFLKFLAQAIITFCVIIAVFILGFSFIYSSAPVKGPSMQPTLNALGDAKSDTVYLHKFANYTYGDIIVIEKLSNMIDAKFIVKRVVGLPGDRITIKQDTTDRKIYLYRNGVKIIEPYIYDNAVGDSLNYGMQTTLEQFLTYRSQVLLNPHNYSDVMFNDKNELVLQKDQIFVLGDNRAQSTDSSLTGPFYTENVVGRVDFIIPHNVSPFLFFLHYYTGIKLY